MACIITAVSQLRASLLASIILGAFVVRAQPLFAQTDVCGLVKAADVAALLGGTPTPTPQGTSCVWRVAAPQRTLGVLTYSSGVQGEMVFAGARKGAERDAASKIADENGLGDKAFSVTPSFGAAFVMLKGGRVLQLQYLTGARGTPKDRDALRVVARNAIASF